MFLIIPPYNPYLKCQGDFYSRNVLSFSYFILLIKGIHHTGRNLPAVVTVVSIGIMFVDTLA